MFSLRVVSSHKLNRECVFVFADKKRKRRWRFSLFLFDSPEDAPDMASGRLSGLDDLRAAVDSRLGCSALNLLRSKSIAAKSALQGDVYGSVLDVMSRGGGAVLMLLARRTLLIYR